MLFCWKTTTKSVCDCLSEVEIVFLLKKFRGEVYLTHTQGKVGVHIMSSRFLRKQVRFIVKLRCNG